MLLRHKRAGSIDRERAACNGTASARRPVASTAASWLLSSQDGHCGITSGGGGHCGSGEQGSWQLSKLLAGAPATWPAAVAACLRRCSRCDRCNHVSISLGYKDCSWYASCPMLHQVPTRADRPSQQRVLCVLLLPWPSSRRALIKYSRYADRSSFSQTPPQAPPSFRSGSLALWRSRRCASKLAPVAHERSPAEWLRSSVNGFCGVTDDDAAQSCDDDDAGTWSFRSLGLNNSAVGPQAWRAATAACLKRCSSCARCRNVSVSLLNQECSWYSSCNRLFVRRRLNRTTAQEPAVRLSPTAIHLPACVWSARSNPLATAAPV